MTSVPPRASCTRQQRTAAANFLSLGGCASRKSLVAVCPVASCRFWCSAKHIPTKAYSSGDHSPCPDFPLVRVVCAFRASAAATHTAWSFGSFTVEKQMLLRSETSRAFRRAKTCREKEQLSFEIILAPCHWRI